MCTMRRIRLSSCSLSFKINICFLFHLLCFHQCNFTLVVYLKCSRHPFFCSGKQQSSTSSLQGWWPTFPLQAITYCTASSHVKFLHHSLLCMRKGFGWWWRWGGGCLAAWNTCAMKTLTTRTCVFAHNKLIWVFPFPLTNRLHEIRLHRPKGLTLGPGEKRGGG